MNMCRENNKDSVKKKKKERFIVEVLWPGNHQPTHIASRTKQWVDHLAEFHYTDLTRPSAGGRGRGPECERRRRRRRRRRITQLQFNDVNVSPFLLLLSAARAAAYPDAGGRVWRRGVVLASLLRLPLRGERGRTGARFRRRSSSFLPEDGSSGRTWLRTESLWSRENGGCC